MARRKKNSAGDLGLFIVGGIVLVIAAIPKEAWIVIGIIGAIALVIWLVSKYSSNQSSTDGQSVESPQGIETQFDTRVIEERPLPLKGEPIAPRWIPDGESIEVANTRLPDGMVFFGSGLRAASGEIDPALIEPRLPVSRSAPDCSQRQTDYWASYSKISSEARRTYLSWLANGKRDPNADIGYVFLYYYGLERRALVDAMDDPLARAELSDIEADVRRLLGIYSSNRSFRGYASSFLEYLSFQQGTIDADGPPRSTSRSSELSSAMKIGLGRLAVAGKPLSAEWAIAWMRSDPRIGCPRVVERCPEEFYKLFRIRYSEVHGTGLKLTVNKTKLRIAYRPASSGFAGKEFALVTDSLPDVSALVAPAKKIESIVESCAESLAPYSRFIAKNPAGANTLDGILLLPQSLWPESARGALESLDKRIGEGLRVSTLGELSASLGGTQTLTRSNVRALAHALEEKRIGIEPDILAGARTPKADDKVILFRSDKEDVALRESNAYQAASVSLDLACSVAMSDGHAHPNELQLLMKQIDGWVQLSAAQRKRLRARLRMALDDPPTLVSLRSKLELIPNNGKRAIAHLMSTLAQADGVVAPEEVKLLEKIYRALGIEAQAVYADLHMATTVGTASPAPPPSFEIQPSKTTNAIEAPASALKLDQARIEALQRETAEVSALLSSVFAGDTPEPEERKEERDEAASIIDQGPLGLDPEHSVFLRLILTRQSWSRQELAEAASDMELMLDGAMERINDASFEHFDAPLLEGDDPIEVLQNVMEKVTA